jgi:hypothetical protein
MTQKKDQQDWNEVLEREAHRLNELGTTLPSVMRQVVELTPAHERAVYKLLNEKLGIEDVELELAKAIQEVRGKL